MIQKMKNRLLGFDMNYTMILLYLSFLFLSGCSNMGPRLTAFSQGWSKTNNEPSEPMKIEKVGFVSKEGQIIGHQYGDRIVYNDGTSGYVR